MQPIVVVLLVIFVPMAVALGGYLTVRLSTSAVKKGEQSYTEEVHAKRLAKKFDKYDCQDRRKQLDEERAIGLTYPPRVKMPKHVVSHAAPHPPRVKSSRPAGHGRAGARPPANVIASMPRKDNNWAGVPVGKPF